MEISQVGISPAVTAITRQLQAVAELQISIMKQLADSQQQMAAMLQSLGVGGNIDLQA